MYFGKYKLFYAPVGTCPIPIAIGSQAGLLAMKLSELLPIAIGRYAERRSFTA